MIEVYVCNRLLDSETSKLYGLANIILDDIIEKLSNIKICLYKKFKEINEETKGDSKEKNRKITISLRIIESNFSEYKFLQNCCLINDLVKEADANIQLMIIKTFIRDWIKNNNNYKLLTPHLTHNLYQEGSSENRSIYFFNKINTYYIYLLDNSVSENDAKVVINRLRYFINYLTVHSWGNCKRLASLFESFIRPIGMLNSIPHAMNWLPNKNKEKNQYMLHFDVTETQRISMGSNLYIMFNHHLSRQFTGADKLVVSTFAALHYCLKFHRSAFSRHHLFRMTEMMSIYSSPELNSIFETTLTQVLWPYIRVIRNGMFRYRFFTWIEQEIRYIARVNDLESASYTFSLNAINDIKAHYRKTLSNVMVTYNLVQNYSGEKGPGLIAEINIVLGDIYFLERSYDEAIVYYQTAVNAHHDFIKEKKYHLECLLRFVEALLKLGNVQEHRQRYERAAMNYFQAKKLVDEFLIQQELESDDFMEKLLPIPFKMNTEEIQGEEGVSDYITGGDAKWVLLKQPYWAFLYLNIKRGHSNRISLQIPPNLYGKFDPYGQYHQGQLHFYLGMNVEAENIFINVIKKFISTNNHEDIDKKYNKQYYSSYLIPKACINLAHNVLVTRMRELTEKYSDDSDWKNDKDKLSAKCKDLLENMKDVSSLEFHNLTGNKIKTLVKNNNLQMKEVLQLIFYAAQQYEKHKLFDHAAMAYLKAISLWVVTIDMLPLNYLDSEFNSFLKKLVNNMHSWLDDASTKALRIIMDSNGGAEQQAREKWYFRDLAVHTMDMSSDISGAKSYKEIHKLKSNTDRKTLSEDIIFWQGSYLGQQLIAMLNWAFTIKRTLSGEDPSPLKSYRMPPYTTRSLILSSWTNGRERLEQARRFRLVFDYKYNLDKCSPPEKQKAEEYNKNKKYINSCINELNSKRIKDLKARDIDNYQNTNLTDEQCYYIISAKAIHNFYTALHYTRILVDNNQAIIIPPSAFVVFHLWRTLYRLVEYEKRKHSHGAYDDIRSIVRTKLLNYVSSDIPTSHLDVDYTAAESIRQLRTLSTMGDSSSISTFNILHNKYYLNDDYEDPGFHLDWTLVQILIPSALMSMKWVDEDMNKLKGEHN